MKKGYQSPKAEKVAFQYTNSVVASSIVCKSGGDKHYIDTGKTNCHDNYWYDGDWKADNLG